MERRPLTARVLRRLARPLMRARRRLYYRAAGGERRPVFHDVDAVCPELRRIDESYDAIRAELDAILGERDRFPRYHEADPMQRAISDTGRDWRVFFLKMTHPDVPLSNAALCPRTVAVLEGIPGLLVAMFSILEPGKSIPAHNGPSYSYLRYHTAFRVPATNPPSIRIRDRHYTWKEGESVLFDDSWEHEVTNESDGVRVVLIVDVLRPAPWYVRAFGGFALWFNGLVLSRADQATLEERVRLRHA